jgi:hypothetical protein
MFILFAESSPKIAGEEKTGRRWGNVSAWVSPPKETYWRMGGSVWVSSPKDQLVDGEGLGGITLSGEATREAPAQVELRASRRYAKTPIRRPVSPQAGECDFRKTKSCMRTKATKVAGGTAKSLAIKMLCVIVERQRWTIATVVNQQERTTVRYCMSCRP